VQLGGSSFSPAASTYSEQGAATGGGPAAAGVDSSSRALQRMMAAPQAGAPGPAAVGGAPLGLLPGVGGQAGAGGQWGELGPGVVAGPPARLELPVMQPLALSLPVSMPPAQAGGAEASLLQVAALPGLAGAQEAGRPGSAAPGSSSLTSAPQHC
jgi:hypothetical protein